jgi:hypothetical protein
MGYEYVTVGNRLIKRQTIPDAVSLSVTWHCPVYSTCKSRGAFSTVQVCASIYAHFQLPVYTYSGWRGRGTGGEKKNIEHRSQPILLHQSPNI